LLASRKPRALLHGNSNNERFSAKDKYAFKNGQLSKLSYAL
jgi:hypothetical protein